VAAAIDLVIAALQARLEAGELRADIGRSQFQHWASSLSHDELLARRNAFVEQVASDRAEALERAKKLAKDMKARGPAADLAPASRDSFEAAERQLGISLPDELRRVYAEVADGGFGPGEGLLPISEIVEQTLKSRADCAQFDVTWPAQLILIQPLALVTRCLDTESGTVVEWDGEAFADTIYGEDEVPIEVRRAVFAEGFRPVAGSFADWIGPWLRGLDPAEAAAFEATRQKEFAEARESWRQRVEAYIVEVRGQSPEERAKLGLKGDGWEETLRKGLLGRS